MSVTSLIDNNKTKILGGATVVLGFVQGYPGLQGMLSPTAFAWTMFVIGLLVVLCGFLNTAKAKEQAKEEIRAEAAPFRSRGFARPLLLAFLLAGASIGTLAIGGCVHTVAAYRQAAVPADYALVVLEHYDSVLVQMAALKASPNVPAKHIAAMQAADIAAQPFIDAINPLRQAYDASHSAADALALQKATDDAVSALADLITAVKAAKEGVR